MSIRIQKFKSSLFLAFILWYIEIEAHIWCFEKSQKIIFYLSLFSAEVLRGEILFTAQSCVKYSEGQLHFCLPGEKNKHVSGRIMPPWDHEENGLYSDDHLPRPMASVYPVGLCSVSAVSCELPHYTQIFILASLMNLPNSILQELRFIWQAGEEGWIKS